MGVADCYLCGEEVYLETNLVNKYAIQHMLEAHGRVMPEEPGKQYCPACLGGPYTALTVHMRKHRHEQPAVVAVVETEPVVVVEAVETNVPAEIAEVVVVEVAPEPEPTPPPAVKPAPAPVDADFDRLERLISNLVARFETTVEETVAAENAAIDYYTKVQSVKTKMGGFEKAKKMLIEGVNGRITPVVRKRIDEIDEALDECMVELSYFTTNSRYIEGAVIAEIAMNSAESDANQADVARIFNERVSKTRSELDEDSEKARQTWTELLDGQRWLRSKKFAAGEPLCNKMWFLANSILKHEYGINPRERDWGAFRTVLDTVFYSIVPHYVQFTKADTVAEVRVPIIDAKTGKIRQDGIELVKPTNPFTAESALEEFHSMARSVFTTHAPKAWLPLEKNCPRWWGDGKLGLAERIMPSFTQSQLDDLLANCKTQMEYELKKAFRGALPEKVAQEDPRAEQPADTTKKVRKNKKGQK